MAIYKKPTVFKSATFRQGFLWAVWGFLAGVYCLQPLLKAAHREERNYFYGSLETRSTTTKDNNSSEITNEKT